MLMPSWRAALADRFRLPLAADILAVAVVVSLPWSTSATNILVVLWLITLAPTLRWHDVRRSLASPAGGLAVAFVALAVLGVLWAEAPMGERFGGLRVYWRFLTIPLLLVQFERSRRGWWVITGFLASCVALLAVSYIIKLFPSLPRANPTPGVPVKDYIVQSGEFLLCAFGLAHVAFTSWQADRRRHAIAAAALAMAFLANIVFVATSRTSVIVFVVLLIAFGLQRLTWKGMAAIVMGGIVLSGLAWASSPYLRSRVTGVADEMQQYETYKAETSSGYRVEFWKKSIGFIATAPVFGHGTGSTEELFRRARTGVGIEAAVTSNPHNQFLLVAIELGFLGVASLLAMWAAHALLFSGTGLAACLGMGVVIQNVVSSLFNAQLFYFTPGWTYVLAVGTLGGLVLAQRAGASDRAGPTALPVHPEPARPPPANGPLRRR